MTETIDLIHDAKKHSQKDLESAYYYLMISDWGKVILEDLIATFDPLAAPTADELHNPFIAARANGTADPIRYILMNIKRMKHHPEQQHTVADNTDSTD